MSDFIEKVLSKNVLYTNMPLDLEIDEGYFKGSYKSILYEFDQKIYIAKIGLPIHKGAYLKIPDGTKLKVRAYSKNAVYIFKSVVYSMGKEGNVRYLIISLPEIIYRIQRRRYARIPIAEEGYFYLKKDLESSKNEVSEKYRFMSKDFSAGGMAIVTKKKLELGQKILINLNLKNDIILENFETEVVRDIGKTPLGDYTYGTKFINVDKKFEETFVKFVFKYERQSINGIL